nr:fatty-acid amide hydrolase 2-like [Anolis sagrei ordinatus]
MALSRVERVLVLALRLFSFAYLGLVSLVSHASAALASLASVSASPPPSKAAQAPPTPTTPCRVRRVVPPTQHPLLLLSARELARRIRRKEVSCVEVIATYIARIKQVNPLINAVVRDR